MNVADKLEKLIAYKSEVSSNYTFDDDYQNIFANEGERKAQYIISDLLSKSEKTGVSLSKFAYLCVGAADGSEPEAILKNTEIRHAIMIEFSDSAADKAKERSKRLSESGRYLYVFTGDANQKLDAAISKLEELKEKENIRGLILSAQAVLHELPRRSPNFKLPIFLGRCFGIFKNNAFYGREPISPERWPNLVELSIPGVKGKRLEVFSRIVNEKLSITEEQPVAVGSEYVCMSNILALEVLHKFLRSRSVPEFSYELGEQLTSINTHEIQRLIEKDLGRGSTRVEPFVTEGFEDAWKRHNVKVRTLDGEDLSIPNTHARIIAFSVTQEDAVTQSELGEAKGEIRNGIKEVQSLLGDHIDAVTQLNREFTICRRDRVGRTRRRAINSILTRLDNLQKESFSSLELRTRLWRQSSLEARSLKEFLYAIEETQRSFEALFKCDLTARERYSAVELVVEWTIDFAQSVGPAIELNTIVARLNEAIKYLGQQIGPNDDPLKPAETVCALLCMRVKCRRALASLYQRRGQRGRTVEKEINKLRAKALEDAERGYQKLQSQASQLELALCLFSNSATAVTEKAKRGMALLEKASDSGSYLLASYELIKQLRLRHEFEDATKVFKSIAELDDDRRRFHANVTHFAASVIGMYYSGADADTVRQNALLACQWLEEVISYDHHKAREIVDYCYLKAICGFSIEDSLEPLGDLKPTSKMAWNDLARMAQQVSQGDTTLGGALLLGLEDAAIWGRIGSLYSDFSKDFPKAIEFYERASLIDPDSPVFHFNKARTLAYGLHDYKLAKISLDYANSLKHRKYGWYKSNENEFLELKTEINANTSG